MPKLRANGIEIEYDTFGRPQDRPLLLIMGLGAQMIFWPEGFCELLARRGHYVVRFDNRDVGLSDKFEAAGLPNVLQLMVAAQSGQPVAAPYDLDDMATDAVGVLDALGLETAHVCGASMGGMIAQAMAIRHPERLRSLVSLMSTTGSPDLPIARPEALAVLVTPAPAGREANIEYGMRVWKVIGSPGMYDEEAIRAQVERAYDRSFYPQGVARQLAAILAHGSRREALRSVGLPTLVIHGDADPLVPVEGGRDTAASIPGAELLILEGMGHDLPAAFWPRLVEAISAHTEKSELAAPNARVV